MRFDKWSIGGMHCHGHWVFGCFLQCYQNHTKTWERQPKSNQITKKKCRNIATKKQAKMRPNHQKKNKKRPKKQPKNDSTYENLAAADWVQIRELYVPFVFHCHICFLVFIVFIGFFFSVFYRFGYASPFCLRSWPKHTKRKIKKKNMFETEKSSLWPFAGAILEVKEDK